MDTPSMRPYALKAGEGWTYHDGIDFTVKAGELGKGRRLAVYWLLETSVPKRAPLMTLSAPFLRYSCIRQMVISFPA
jgi:hypothetical protein